MVKLSPFDVRQRLGLTQQGLAEVCNTAVGTVRKWESGVQSPSGPAARLLELLVWIKERGLLAEFVAAERGE